MTERVRRPDRRHWLWLTSAAVVLVSAVFWLWPVLDVMVSRQFYAPPYGFIGDDKPALVALLKAGRGIGWAVGAFMIGVVALRYLRPELVSIETRRRWWVALLAVVLGPGLLVNGILKAHMGRPRPLQTYLFGGTADFVPVWTYSKGCLKNCSFVSGEASFGLFLIVFAFWFTGPRRWLALALIGAFGIAMSINRIAFGAHFLSDVLLAWGLTALIILLLDRYLPEELAKL